MFLAAIDDSDFAGAFSRLLHLTRWLDYIIIRSVDDLVEGVVGVNAEAGGRRKVSELHLWDHGLINSFQVGDDVIMHWDRSSYEAQFRKLGRNIAPGGFFCLHNCLVGQDVELMKWLAATVGRDVYASVHFGTPADWRVPSSQDGFLKPDGSQNFDGAYDPSWIEYFVDGNDGGWSRFSPTGEVVRAVKVSSHASKNWIPSRVPRYDKVMP
ncbi:DUF4347 domain-containing protein [Alphaproteobacteria bacterium KMM 3653]|uniref:DUF4347 domain-containing protein n=1 Tax=Harenicola maris TaxID=2841044 RepID=A0AAP2G831_9RHOB|nr:DUF4347 domain-containing protein [Harenicola maris]